MTSLPKNVFSLTSDGTRTNDIYKLVSSISEINHKFIVFINQSPTTSNYADLFKLYNIDYHIIEVGNITPLSIVRNLALDYIENNLFLKDTDYLIFSDDDCFYSSSYCKFLNENRSYHVNVFPVIDSNSDELFISRGVPKITLEKKIKTQDLMFYTCSISFVLPYRVTKGYRFNYKIGLGNTINQGEETDYLEKLISSNVIDFIFHPNINIYHPRKTNYPNNVFYSLSYFLSYKCINSSNKAMYIKYSGLFYFKYILISFLLLWKKKYRNLFLFTIRGIKDGIKDKYLCFN